MPRFNFAADPEEEKKEAAESAARHRESIAQEARKESDNAPPQQPESTSAPETNAEEVSPEAPRQLSYDETIPPAYREAVHERYMAPPQPATPTPPAEQTPPSEDIQEEQPATTLPEDPLPVPPVELSDDDLLEAALNDLPEPEEPVFIPEEAPIQSAPEPVLDEIQEQEEIGNPFEDLEFEDLQREERVPPPPIGDDFPEAPRKRSILPLVGIAAIVLFLISVSIIWFFNPYPPLREAMEGFFFGPKTEQPETVNIAMSENGPVAYVDSVDEVLPPTRDWNYYLQISAFKELYKAQDDANRLRKLGLNAKVEGEFIPSQRKTYYRVRLGPFPTALAAALKGDSLKGVIPGSAFIDSIRVEADVIDSTANEEPIQQPLLKKPSRTASTQPSTTPPAPTAQQPAEKTVTAATAGYAVHVGSYRTLKTAQQESRSLIGRGLPAYTSKSVQASTAWYRVLVGPFRTRQEAERYLEIVRKESSSSAYVRSLGD